MWTGGEVGMSSAIEGILAELDGFRMCDQMDYNAYSRLYDLISSIDVQEWISVKNRLPCNGKSVLVAHSQGVTIAWYNGFYWTHGAASKHKSIKTVKAWMPLPLPPEE